jgi:glycine cleavage system regulatory protein
MNSLVFTFIGPDKPGLIEKVSRTVNEHGGNWLESRMSQLAGQFAGIVRVAISDEQTDKLSKALHELSDNSELTIVLQPAHHATTATDHRLLRLSVIGNDRPGIVREITKALAQRHINIVEMDTSVTSAPMSGDPLFEAVLDIQFPKAQSLDDLNDNLDSIADELTIEIALEEVLR